MNRAIQTIIRDIQQQTRQRQLICTYYYDLDGLRQHLKAIMAALPGGCQMFYAMKANSEPKILATIAPWVHGFEVASLGEIEKARQISADLPLIFGGPGKTDDELQAAIAQRVQWFHVESLHELRRLDLIASRLNQPVTILLRINLRGSLPEATLQMAGRPTQFGIDETQLEQALHLARASAHLQLKGIHFHSVSNQLNAEQHLALLDNYCDRLLTWSQTYGFGLSTLNVGGGIGINYAQPEQSFDWTGFTTGLSTLLTRHPALNLSLVFECGRFLTAACGYYAVEVLDIKPNHGKTFVVVRGGTHHFRLPVSWNHNHPLQVIPLDSWTYPFERPEVQQCPVTIVGQLCTPKDVFARDVYIDRLRIGDAILFTHAGAYGWAISHHDFLSHPHPRVTYLETTSTQPAAQSVHRAEPAVG